MSFQKMMSTRDAFGEELVELGRKHKEIVVLDADLSKATRTCSVSYTHLTLPTTPYV